jgi:hypothetical protein
MKLDDGDRESIVRWTCYSGAEVNDVDVRYIPLLLLTTILLHTYIHFTITYVVLVLTLTLSACAGL